MFIYNYLSPNFLKSFWQHKVPTRIELNLDCPNLSQEGAKSSRCGLAVGTEGSPSSRATSTTQGKLKGGFIPTNSLLDLHFFEVVFSETLSESWLLLKGFTHTATQQSLLNNRTKSIRLGIRECSIHLKWHGNFNRMKLLNSAEVSAQKINNKPTAFQKTPHVILLF